MQCAEPRQFAFAPFTLLPRAFGADFRSDVRSPGIALQVLKKLVIFDKPEQTQGDDPDRPDVPSRAVVDLFRFRRYVRWCSTAEVWEGWDCLVFVASMAYIIHRIRVEDDDLDRIYATDSNILSLYVTVYETRSMDSSHAAEYLGQNSKPFSLVDTSSAAFDDCAKVVERERAVDEVIYAAWSRVACLNRFVQRLYVHGARCTSDHSIKILKHSLHAIVSTTFGVISTADGLDRCKLALLGVFRGPDCAC